MLCPGGSLVLSGQVFPFLTLDDRIAVDLSHTVPVFWLSVIL